MKDWIEQVAEATGKSPQAVRLAIQNGWEIGTAIKLSDSVRYNYFPHPQKIKELIGIDIGEDHVKDHNGTCRGRCNSCHASTEKG